MLPKIPFPTLPADWSSQPPRWTVLQQMLPSLKGPASRQPLPSAFHRHITVAFRGFHHLPFRFLSRIDRSRGEIELETTVDFPVIPVIASQAVGKVGINLCRFAQVPAAAQRHIDPRVLRIETCRLRGTVGSAVSAIDTAGEFMSQTQPAKNSTFPCFHPGFDTKAADNTVNGILVDL